MDTIYAYWDAQQIKYVLDAVAMLTSMSDYTGLMKVFAIFGLFVAVATTFVKARGEDAAIYMLMLAIWYVGLFLPKKDVVVVDVAGGSGTYTVANVPLGLAVFASAESHIGYWLTKVSETVFALPGDISFEKTGFMFGSRAIKDRQSVRFYDPNLVSSLTNLTKDCVYPELNNNGPFFDQIMKSGDIWADIAPQMNPGLLVQVYDNAAGVYKVVGCDQAWSYIDAQINPHVSNDILPRLGRMLNPSSPTSAAASALVAAQLPAVDNFIFGVSQTAQESIKQAAMINLIADSTVFVPQMIGDTTSAQVALSTAMASASANSSYRTMAKIAESSMPLIRNAIHIVILALFPIVMLLIIVAGSKGGLVLKTYLMALLWINLWAPVYAALNFFTSWYATLGAKAAVDGMNPLSYASHQALMHSMISDQGVAGILTLSVPVIAYMLTNVSAASFTSVISGVMSPANSSAQAAGAQVGTGNISAGNTQWGNVTMGNWSANNRSADQWNTAPTNRHGSGVNQAVGSDGSMISTFGNGQFPSVLNRAGTVSDLGEVGGMVGTVVATQAQTLSKNSFQQAGEASAARSSSLTAAYDKAQSFLQSAGSSTRVGSDAGVGSIAQFAQTYESAMNTASKWDAGIKLSDTEKQQLLKEVSANFGAGVNVGALSAGVRASLKHAAASESQIQSVLDSARSYAESSGFKDQLNKAQSFNNTISTSTGSESARRASSEIRASLSDADRAEHAQRVSLSQAEAYERVASETRSGEGRAQADLSNFIVAQLGGAARANTALGSRDTAGQLALVDGYIKEWVQNQAGLMRQGDNSANAGLEPATKLSTPTPGGEPNELYQDSASDIRGGNTANQSRVPGNPHASPAMIVDRDGPGGQSGQTVTPVIVERAAKAGANAADIAADEGRDEAGQGRKTVTTAVQEEQGDADLFERAAGSALDVNRPRDRNPAVATKNTGGANGEW